MADQFFGITDTGKERKNNEDTFIAQQGARNKFIIASVIDGVGGYSGGEVAAELAREAFLKRLNKPSGEIVPMLIDSFNQANDKILSDKQTHKEHDSMACVATLAVVDIDKNQFYYAHVGDTRLYLLRDQSLVKITHDHSFVGFLEDSGRLTEEGAMTHPKRNEINKALGFESQLSSNTDYIETGHSPFLPGDMLLLCSDGLTDMVNKQDITDIITSGNSLKEKCKLLVDLANQNGGRDNITVVLVENNKAPVQHDATMPTPGIRKNSDEVIEESNVQYQAQPTEPSPTATPKSNTALITVLVVLMLAFLGSTIWLYLQSKNQIVGASTVSATPVKSVKDPQEMKLQKAIDSLKGHVLILDTSYKSPIIISEAININKDTLFIKTSKGVTIQSDSAYKGAAFIVLPKNKFLMLDSLSFNNFEIGIATANNGIVLKSVTFNNCKTAVQNYINVINQKAVSGKVPTAVLKVDSTPAKTK